MDTQEYLSCIVTCTEYDSDISILCSVWGMVMKKRIVCVAAVLLLLFAALAVLANTGILLEWEHRVYHLIARQMTAERTAFLRTFTRLGDPLSVIAICLALLLIPRLRRSVAVPVVAATVIAAGLNKVLKHVFLRERPSILWLIEESGFSFPSGHAMTNMALYLILSLLAVKHLRHPAARFLLPVLLVGSALLIGFSRVYLGVHYAGDVLAGWALGAAVALVVYALWDRLPARKNNCGSRYLKR